MNRKKQMKIHDTLMKIKMNFIKFYFEVVVLD